MTCRVCSAVVLFAIFSSLSAVVLYRRYRSVRQNYGTQSGYMPFHRPKSVNLNDLSLMPEILFHCCIGRHDLFFAGPGILMRLSMHKQLHVDIAETGR